MSAIRVAGRSIVPIQLFLDPNCINTVLRIQIRLDPTLSFGKKVQ